MKKLKVIIAYICLGALNLVAEDTIFAHPNDMLSLQCVQNDTSIMDIDSTSTVAHVSIDFNDITQQTWNWHYLVEILSVLAALVVPIGSYIWTYKTNEQNNQYQAEQALREYKWRMDEKYHDECVKKQGDILAILCQLNGEVCDNNLPAASKITEITSTLIASSPYLVGTMYETASSVIRLIESCVNNKTSLSDDEKTNLNFFVGNYINEYQEYIRNKNKV